MNAIKKLLHGADRHWPLFLDFVQFVYNAKVHSLSGSRPFVLFFNRTPNELRDYTVDPVNPPVITLDEWKQHQEKLLAVIFPALDERIKALSASMRKRLDAHRRVLLERLPAGTVVYRLDPLRKDKREARYIGPYTIARVAQNGSYVLRDAEGDIVDHTVPIDQLKIANDDVMDNVYVVEDIMDVRGEDGAHEYLVKWKGYEEQTWVKQHDFNDQAIIRNFWKRRQARQ
jgi:hypothetical protein